MKLPMSDIVAYALHEIHRDCNFTPKDASYVIPFSLGSNWARASEFHAVEDFDGRCDNWIQESRYKGTRAPETFWLHRWTESYRYRANSRQFRRYSIKNVIYGIFLWIFTVIQVSVHRCIIRLASAAISLSCNRFIVLWIPKRILNGRCT